MLFARPNVLWALLLPAPLLWFLQISADRNAARPSDVRPRTTLSPGIRHLDRGERIARTALAFRGGRYVFGGNGPHGFDCSGLTQAICRQIGLVLQRTAAEQFTRGLPVSFEHLAPGDLVFFRNTYKRGISHVGIYIGEGRFVHAANREKGIIVSSLFEPYYARRLAGARRMVTAPNTSTGRSAAPKHSRE
ncbi:MAG: C40 family peptidase [Chthonomonadales bacterium]